MSPQGPPWRKSYLPASSDSKTRGMLYKSTPKKKMTQIFPLSSWVAASGRAGGQHTVWGADGPLSRETPGKCGSGFGTERESNSSVMLSSDIHRWIYLSWFYIGLGAKVPHVQQKEDRWAWKLSYIPPTSWVSPRDRLYQVTIQPLLVDV